MAKSLLQILSEGKGKPKEAKKEKKSKTKKDNLLFE